MIEFFAAFGLLFWVGCAATLIAVAISVEYENGPVATLCLAIGAAAVCLLTKFNPWSWVVTHQMLVAQIVGAYFLIGAFWGIARYWFFLKGVQQALQEFKENRKISGQLSDGERSDFISSQRYVRTLPPRVSDSRDRILVWMTYWPLSMPWTLINEPVKRFFRYVYFTIAAKLQAMSDRMFTDI